MRQHSARAGSVTHLVIDHTDFSVVVKQRGRLPDPWKWEIYRAGRATPVDQSKAFFNTATQASHAGKKALRLFLSQFQE
jgi:hypothetical protein